MNICTKILEKMSPTEKSNCCEADGTPASSSNSESEISQMDDDRSHWGNKVDFILSCIGCAVGLGNIWRFPYLCYKNGGGSFLVPYMFCLLFGAFPVLFLEVFVGQYMQRAGVKAWEICPAFKGIGIASNIVLFLNNCFYNIILAWALYYLFMSVRTVLPWAHCNNSWNTPRCAVSVMQPGNETSNANLSDVFFGNGTGTTNQTVNSSLSVDPAVEFWERKVLQMSSGIDQPGELVWELVLALFIAWVFCYFCIWKGISKNMPVVYVTVTMPYVLLTVLLIRGVTLPGAKEGLLFFIQPDFSRLQDPQVWLDAGTQIFFSLAVALGPMITMGSYNKFKHNSYRDAYIITVINSFTSMFGGMVIFSVLGFMAKQQNVRIQDVAESGPGLAFIVYPKAVAMMPIAPLWAVLFCITLLFLGFDTQFVCLEGFISNFIDAFPILRKGWNRQIYTAVYCAMTFIVTLPMVTNGGIYVFQLFDYYGVAGVSLFWISLWECVAIGWVYGGRRMYDNIEVMLGFRISSWLRLCWMFVTPGVITAICIFTWVKFKLLKYNRTYEYPWWGHAIGLAMTLSSMISIPIYLLVSLLRTPGSIRARWKFVTTPVTQSHHERDHPLEVKVLSPVAMLDEAVIHGHV